MLKWVQMSDFSIALPNRPGELARLAARFRAADVSLIGLWGYGGTEGDFARVYCVPESADQFRAFARSAELQIKEGHTFYLRGDDHANALVKMLERIATAGVNLHAIQSVAHNGEFGCFVWADPSDWPTLKDLIQ